MNNRRHIITCHHAELDGLLPIISSHAALSDQGYDLVGATRYKDDEDASVTIESRISGHEMRDLLEAHTTEYTYKAEPLITVEWMQ